MKPSIVEDLLLKNSRGRTAAPAHPWRAGAEGEEVLGASLSQAARGSSEKCSPRCFGIVEVSKYESSSSQQKFDANEH